MQMFSKVNTDINHNVDRFLHAGPVRGVRIHMSNGISHESDDSDHRYEPRDCTDL